MAIKLDRDNRLVVYKAGGFTGGLLDTPVDITIDKLPDDAFETVQEIIEILSTKEQKLECSDQTRGDYGYYVFVGDHNDKQDDLQCLFEGNFRPTPDKVRELDNILKKHASSQDLKLKP